ncbi:MAG TPA: beta-L-arabinofuranosidase domain-containing protein [Fimbriimonas sp.]|nr:beta-L-arabinofuranosidase domain-containing protein [Fimbriimonas sp.]
MTHRLAHRTQWGPGPIQEIVDLSFRQRVVPFIQEALPLFDPEERERCCSGDWYGEHVGKWLVTAAAALRRTESDELRDQIETVITFLSSCQEETGYLGAYASHSSARFTHPEASSARTWDLWIHSWLVLGLLANRQCGEAKEIALRIGKLWLRTFRGRSVLDQGNHAGLSALVILEPLAKLADASSDNRYLDLAKQVLKEAECKGLRLLGADPDVATIGTGKIYQLLWAVKGLVALYSAERRSEWLDAARAIYEDVRANHLTPYGGPWGGMAGHKEVFNVRGFFSPYGLVETCSTATWMSLSRELFLLTGEEVYVSEFERAFRNGLLGAIDENGRDWCYFTFPNGRRNNTYHWACCKSSGAMALEESAEMVVTATDDGISVNLLVPSESHLTVGGHSVTVVQEEGSLTVKMPEPMEMSVSLRAPNGCTFKSISPEANVRRTWRDGDHLSWELDEPLQVHPFTYTLDHHGQEIVRQDYVFVSRGPYVYATGLVDGYRADETQRLPQLFPTSRVRVVDESGLFGPVVELRLPGEGPVRFLPYAEAGGRHNSAWRSAWLPVAWQ